ncbi:phytoene desaturase family protein [Catalinimonas niigatensis]|uniref:phytoene desaturase family protein n=1 Tax=Catalinimonas niigatensis TaxID=1397264 RepID=UPI0026650FB7|nr:NAD(P)/FAD-dependent oxidoreductase [Catalinimonas niigatensis]WPP49803.1 NAD(P)/FAD-dependent oxidoreductase [Catalinimonas niigatensis]
MAKEKSIIIIGAGIAGLSAGYYGSINGFKVTILEKAEKAGGQCTSWKHEDYTINGCIHWLVGSGPGNKMYELWKELGAIHGTEMVNHDRFAHFENVEGEDVILFCDPDKLKAHLLGLAPEEKRFIHSFTRAIRVLKESHNFHPNGKEQSFSNIWANLGQSFKGFYVYREILKWARYSCGDIAKKIENPYLKTLFFGLGKDMPIIAILFTLGWMNNQQAGYPVGGSGHFTAKIVDKFLASGGAIQYQAPVKEILVRNDCAKGIILEDGRKLYADYVVSAADGYTTIYHMLQGKYKNKKIDRYYLSFPLFKPVLFASFGINYPFKGLEGTALGRSFPLDNPLKAGTTVHNRLSVQIYNFDPTLAPEGKTLITSMIETDYEYWKALAKDQDKYKKEKGRFLMDLLERLTARFPAIMGKVEMMDLATPITYENYTGVYKGSYEGWRLTKDTFMKKMKKKLPGLENFYMAGQWVEPGGGLPPSAMSGKRVIQMICKQEKQKFIPSLPSVATTNDFQKVIVEHN